MAARELLNPNLSWKIGSGSNLDTITASTVKGNTLSAVSGGEITVSSNIKIAGAFDVNGQTINGNSGNLTGFTSIGASSISATGGITATGGFSGALTGNVTGNLTGDVTGNVSGSAGTVTALTGHTTTNLPEGDNKYFTNARAQEAIPILVLLLVKQERIFLMVLVSQLLMVL
jgi:hypothetical protein